MNTFKNQVLAHLPSGFYKKKKKMNLVKKASTYSSLEEFEKIFNIASGLPSVIPYKGWLIYEWSGWRGHKRFDYHHDFDCHFCGKTINISNREPCYISLDLKVGHWTCKYPDNTLDRLSSEWLAVKFGATMDDSRYLQTQCAQGWSPCSDGEYKRGDIFPSAERDDLLLITEESLKIEKEFSVYSGLMRMYALIDRLEDSNVH